MKLITSFIFLLSLVSVAKAQKSADSILKLDERGKLIYYEVVDVKVPKDTLKSRVLNYLKKQDNDFKYKVMKGDTVFSGSGKIVINKTVLVMSHPSGEILYNFQIEIRAGKYRFWLTDFSFIPYQRDRYGNFVASTSVGVPLENDPGKLNAAQWAAYQVQTAQFCQKFKAKLKVALANPLPVPLINPEKTKINKNW